MSALRPATAASEGLVGCHVCDLLVQGPGPGDGRACCPRCGSQLHSRKPNSLVRTWALLVAAIILYVPAMAWPVMITTTLGEVREDTVMSGVEFLLVTGMWPLAAVVFFASVVVPVLKILGLFFLLITVRRGSLWRRRDRTRLYRLIEIVGRWSMVDVYVVTILGALVRLQTLGTVDPGPGIVFFAAVVVLTMFAAMSFDPRIIWDAEEGNGRG